MALERGDAWFSRVEKGAGLIISLVGINRSGCRIFVKSGCVLIKEESVCVCVSVCLCI